MKIGRKLQTLIQTLSQWFLVRVRLKVVLKRNLNKIKSKISYFSKTCKTSDERILLSESENKNSKTKVAKIPLKKTTGTDLHIIKEDEGIPNITKINSPLFIDKT